MLAKAEAAAASMAASCAARLNESRVGAQGDMAVDPSDEGADAMKDSYSSVPQMHLPPQARRRSREGGALKRNMVCEEGHDRGML